MRHHVVILLGAAVLLLEAGCGRMSASPPTTGPAVASLSTSATPPPPFVMPRTTAHSLPSPFAPPRVPVTTETATAGATETATTQAAPRRMPCPRVQLAPATTVATATANAATEQALLACMRRVYSATATADAATVEQAAIRLRPQLQQHRRQWQAQHIRHYRYQVQAWEGIGISYPVLIEVANGKPAAIRLAITPTPAPLLPPPDSRLVAQIVRRYDTIDKVFDIVQAALDQRAQEIRVSYDPTFGYPTQIFVDPMKGRADDEFSLAISRFEVLK